MTAAITEAVRARLEQVRRQSASRTDRRRSSEAARSPREMRERMGQEYLSQDFDALLYDEMGLPK